MWPDGPHLEGGVHLLPVETHLQGGQQQAGHISSRIAIPIEMGEERHTNILSGSLVCRKKMCDLK
jgi:hypothetical protein